MMGYKEPGQGKLFYSGLNIDQKVRKNHPLRNIHKLVDFEFFYTNEAKREIRMRQHLMERSFARGKRYGYDRSRWRGLWRVQIQEYMTAAIQNIEVLIRHAKGTVRVAMTEAMMDTIKTGVYSIKYFFTRVKSGLFFIKNMQQKRATVQF